MKRHHSKNKKENHLFVYLIFNTNKEGKKELVSHGKVQITLTYSDEEGSPSVSRFIPGEKS